MYTLYREQVLPISMEQAWDFLSSPDNLGTITPDYMSFEITTSPPPEKMYPGMIVGYKVRPLFGIPMEWVTEITHVEYLSYFVDEQRFGPYSFWHHKHFIKEVPQGVNMIDLLHYKLPMGIFGNIAHGLFVRKQLEGIFNYRFNKLHEIFGYPEGLKK